MAFEDRDYAWDSGARRGYLGTGDTAVRWLIGVCIALFCVQLVTVGHTGGVLTEWFGLYPSRVLHGQVWRLFTYAFLHSEFDLWHIVVNLIWLWGLGRPLEQRVGTTEFLWFYAACAVLGGLVFMGLELVFPGLGEVATRDGVRELPCVGASAAVMGVVIAMAVWEPHRSLNFILICLPLWVVAAAFVVFNTYPVLLQIGGAGSARGVAHGAHFGGLLFGFIYAKQHWHLSSLFDGFDARRLDPRRLRPRGSAKPKVRVYDPDRDEREELSVRVDDLLRKIHDRGEASLTPDEREFLTEASRTLRRTRR